MRGILGGGFWGLVVGGAAVAGASLVNPPPREGAETAVAGDIQTTPLEDVAPVTTEIADTDAITAPPVTVATAPDVIEPDQGAAPPNLSRDSSVDLADQPAAVEAPESDSAVAASVSEPPPPAPVENVKPVISEDSSPAGAITAEVDTPEAPDETLAPDALAGTDAAPEATDAPSAVLLADTSGHSTPDTETASAEQPSVAAADTLETPPVGEDTSVVTAASDEPVLPNPQSDAPEAPGADTLDLAAADVAGPPGPAPDIATDAPSASALPDENTTAPVVEGVADAVQTTPAAPALPSTPETGNDLPAADTTLPGLGDEVATGPIGEDTVVITETPEAAPEEVVVVEDTTAPAVSVMPGGGTGVKVNRFGADGVEDTVEAETAAPDPESFPDGTPAIVRFGVAGENPNDLPEMSIILVDDGSQSNPVAAVSGIGFPVSVMLDPTIADAAERLAAYRAAGIEVGLVAALPPSATPTDVAVFFEAALGTLSETVAVLDAGGETQADTEVIRETVAALAEDGRGLITVPRGLNSAQRVAAENGVPAGVIYRELDGEGQDSRVIGRFLDQAAFRARQDSGVILLGKVRDDTLAALTEWATGSRAQQVAMQPVSTVLQANP